MAQAKCKVCGAVWNNRSEIRQSTKDEHQLATGHELELV